MNRWARARRVRATERAAPSRTVARDSPVRRRAEGKDNQDNEQINTMDRSWNPVRMRGRSRIATGGNPLPDREGQRMDLQGNRGRNAPQHDGDYHIVHTGSGRSEDGSDGLDHGRSVGAKRD